MDLSRYSGVVWKEAVQDCWWLVRDFYAWQYEVSLPRICVDSANPLVARRELKNNPVRQCFSRIDKPSHGCVVELSMACSADHVGVFLVLSGRPWLLHNEREAGVCVTPFDEVTLQYKIKGFFEYVG